MRGCVNSPRPGEYAGLVLSAMAARLEERARLAPQELAAAKEGLAQLRQAAHRALPSIWIRATDAANRINTLKVMASGRYVFALFGWVPASRRNRVVELITRLGDRILYTFEPADEQHEPARVPVMLENPGWVRPFEPLISFLNMPRYDGWDPTWITAALFPLWVGMIMGDVGYGLVFLGIAWYLSTLARGNQDLRRGFFQDTADTGGGGAIGADHEADDSLDNPLGYFVWGGFRQSLPRLGIFGTRHHPGLVPTLIPRTEIGATADAVNFGFHRLRHHPGAARFHPQGPHEPPTWREQAFLGSERLLRRRHGPGPLRLRFHDRELSAVAAHTDVCGCGPLCGRECSAPECPSWLRNSRLKAAIS